MSAPAPVESPFAFCVTGLEDELELPGFELELEYELELLKLLELGLAGLEDELELLGLGLENKLALFGLWLEDGLELSGFELEDELELLGDGRGSSDDELEDELELLGLGLEDELKLLLGDGSSDSDSGVALLVLLFTSSPALSLDEPNRDVLIELGDGGVELVDAGACAGADSGDANDTCGFGACCCGGVVPS
ncbi:hypothetical protein AGMMS49936_11530 [Endomicrobiia bacterium]|nr:hypothetical protein AGMMS49936_11530 [Endomicrobiia bacterium]